MQMPMAHLSVYIFPYCLLRTGTLAQPTYIRLMGNNSAGLDQHPGTSRRLPLPLDPRRAPLAARPPATWGKLTTLVAINNNVEISPPARPHQPPGHSTEPKKERVISKATCAGKFETTQVFPLMQPFFGLQQEPWTKCVLTYLTYAVDR